MSKNEKALGDRTKFNMAFLEDVKQFAELTDYMERMRMTRLVGVIVLLGTCTLPSLALSQVILERNVSMGMAKAIVDGAMERCIQDGFKVVVVVVDRSGQMAAMLRA